MEGTFPGRLPGCGQAAQVWGLLGKISGRDREGVRGTFGAFGTEGSPLRGLTGSLAYKRSVAACASAASAGRPSVT
jgi:hypothetical protein